MKSLRVYGLAIFAAFFCITGMAEAQDKKKIRVLIVDGQNNHNWKDTTPFLKKQLEVTDLFSVDVSTTPQGKRITPAQWKKWDPDFSKYDVVLSNYNGQTWPAHVRKKFEKFVKNGGGLVNVHAANNRADGWTEYQKMTGLLWKRNSFGFRIAFDKDKKKIKVEKNEGPGAGHGPQHSYTVVTFDRTHPITEGMPLRWKHTRDELYHGQRGPAENMHVLAIAFSDKNQRGTGLYEPMLWWIPYGKGRCVTCVLGHVGRNANKTTEAMRCVGFLTIVRRSCEWAATDKVTLGIPNTFPTADQTVTVGN